MSNQADHDSGFGHVVDEVVDHMAGAIDQFAHSVLHIDSHLADHPAADVHQQAVGLGTETDAIVGDPAQAEQVWHEQLYPDTCAVVTQEFVLEELTGHPHSEDDLAVIAWEHGWYTPGGGTPMDDVGNLLEYYGVPVEQEHGASLNDIQQALEDGQKVIVGVDSGTIWNQDESGLLDDFTGVPDQGADHAV